MNHQHVVFTLAIATTFLVALSARATEADRAAFLFDQGIAEMEAHHYDQGCPKIEESHNLDPLPGTLFTLAQCEAARGRVATAIARYDEYLSLYPTLSQEKKEFQKNRPQIARDRKTELEADVAALIVEVAPGVPESAIVYFRDSVLPRDVLGKPIVVDPGEEYEVQLQVTGAAMVTKRIPLLRGERRRLMLKLEPTASPVVTDPEPTPAPVAMHPKPPPSPLALSPGMGGTAPTPLATKPPPYPRAVPPQYAGAALATGAVGVVSGIILLSIVSTSEADTPNRAALMGLGATELAIGAVGGVMGGILVSLSRRPASQQTVLRTPAGSETLVTINAMW